MYALQTYFSRFAVAILFVYIGSRNFYTSPDETWDQGWSVTLSRSAKIMVSWKNWIKDHRIKDQGSVQNESNNLNKSCLIAHLRDSVNAQAKIRENKRNRHKYNRYNKHKYTKYWKSHTKLEVEVPIFAYRLLRQLFKTDSYSVGLLVHTLYPHEISKLSRVSVCDYVSDFLCNFKTRSRFWKLPEWTANFQPLLLHLFKFSLTSYP